MATSKLSETGTYKDYKVYKVKRKHDSLARFIVKAKDLRRWRQDDFVNAIEETYASKTIRHGFGLCLRLRYSVGERKIVVKQEFWPRLEQALPKANLFHRTPSEAISMELLYDCNFAAGYQTERTALVAYDGKLYIAKAPEDTNDAPCLVTEFHLLHSLKHPHIIPPPQHVIKPSDTSDRIIAYLLEYYPNENLQEYALKLWGQDVVRLGVFRGWAAQITDVLQYLLYVGTHRYANIKPENCVVDDDKNLIMIDFGKTTACNEYSRAPEVYYRLDLSWSSLPSGATELCYRTPLLDCRKGSCIPEWWPLRAHENAMVYSLGRTFWRSGRQHQRTHSQRNLSLYTVQT